MRFNKLLFGPLAVCLATGALALTPNDAAAASFTIDFCDVNAAECTEDNLTEASLTFTEIAGGDPNDYDLALTLAGTGTDTIDQVSFTIGGVQTPGGYESRPTVTNPGPDGQTWTVYYDNVNNATSCTSDGGSQEVCASSPGPGPSVAGTQTWNFFVDLVDSLGIIGPGSALNLRAHFLTSDGKPGGNFSPDGGIISTTTDVTTIITTETNLPEPTLLTLLGAGLAGASLRLRRRNRKA